MSSEAKKTSVLEACLARGQNVAGLIDYAADAIVSKTILDSPAGTITLFAFDKGQRLSEHQAPYDAVVEVVDGKGVITIAGAENEVGAGEIIIMPGNVPHAVSALEKFKMLLTMIRA
ncbi:MAG: cupin domain-containing protein [Planctomycetota bacterium]|nr:MAG: cupin domain-containing protein [Planctomycetota bacterium]